MISHWLTNIRVADRKSQSALPLTFSINCPNLQVASESTEYLSVTGTWILSPQVARARSRDMRC